MMGGRSGTRWARASQAAELDRPPEDPKCGALLRGSYLSMQLSPGQAEVQDLGEEE